jgi:hypothetical protein
VSVKIVTPSDAASSPSHPDHARWVKERTLGIEADHARTIGQSFRDAETANIENLIRLDARRNQKRKPQKKAPKQTAKVALDPEHARIKEVKKTIPKIRTAPASKCNYCGFCRKCKRERRVSEIMAAARGGEQRAHHLAMEMTAIVMAMGSRRDYKDAIGRELPFSRLTGADTMKALVTGCEWACDRSVSFLGEWR